MGSKQVTYVPGSSLRFIFPKEPLKVNTSTEEGNYPRVVLYPRVLEQPWSQFLISQQHLCWTGREGLQIILLPPAKFQNLEKKIRVYLNREK